MRFRGFLILFVCIAVFLTSLPMESWAISAWARRYGTDCSMCHWKLNKLNGIGKNFMKLGHRLADETAMKDSKGLAALGDYISFTEKVRILSGETSNGVTTDFTIEALSIYMGGPLLNGFSFFYEHYLFDWGQKKGSPTKGEDKMADAILQYTSPGDKHYLTFRVGQFIPLLVHTHGGGARLPISRPMTVNTPAVKINNTEIKYNPRDRQLGAEIGGNIGILGGWHTTLAVVNGNSFSRGDNNNYKDLIATTDITFDDAGSQLGFYFYKGQYVNDISDYYRAGVMGNVTSPFSWLELDLSGAYYMGAFTRTDGKDPMNVMGFYAELDYALPSILNMLSLFARYDYWDEDVTTADNQVSGPALGISCDIIKLGRITLEADLYNKGKKSGNTYSQTRDYNYMLEIHYMY